MLNSNARDGPFGTEMVERQRSDIEACQRSSDRTACHALPLPLFLTLSLSHTLSLSLTVTHTHSSTLTRSITRTHTFSLSTIQAPSRSLSPSSNEMSYFYPILVKIEKTFPLGHIIHSNQDSDGKKTGTEYPSSGLLLLS